MQHNFKIYFSLIFILFIIAISIAIKYFQNRDNYRQKCKNDVIENYPNQTSSTAINVLYTDQSGNIGTTVLISPGTIAIWTSTTPPPGWAICDGSNGTPDLRGRFILGAGQGSGLTYRIFNNKGGTETETLNINQVPWHNHTATLGAKTVSTSWNGNHNHGYTYINTGYSDRNNGCDNDDEQVGSSYTYSGTTTNGGNHNHSFTVDYGTITSSGQGGGQSHNNMPPFHILTFIMKL